VTVKNPISKTISEAPSVHGLNIFRKMRRKRDGGGALYELMPRDLFQAAGGFFERIFFTEVVFCIGKDPSAGKGEVRVFPI